MDERSVMRAIAELEAADHITVDRTNGRHSVYRIHPQPVTASHRHHRQPVTGEDTATSDNVTPTSDNVSVDPCQVVTGPLSSCRTNQKPLKNQEKQPAKEQRQQPPYDDILKGFNTLFADYKISRLTAKRRALIDVVARSSKTNEYYLSEWWVEFFEFVRKNDWLMGRINGKDGTPFELRFDWLFDETNFAKVIEGEWQKSQAWYRHEGGRN